VRSVRVGLGAVPWWLAIAGLLIALVASGFVTWPLVLLWSSVLALVWFAGGAMVPTRTARIVAGILLLPVLAWVLAFQGGWWLIPADLAWLAIEIADRDPRRLPGESPA
jgi:hypothetical protein